MTVDRFAEIITRNCQPLEPQPTNTPPSLGPLKRIRAVLFDIYGTLLISASGDIGNSQVASKGEALKATAELLSVQLAFPPQAVVSTFENTIRQMHTASQQRGIEYPEVDIVEVWQQTLSVSALNRLTRSDAERFSLEYEVRVNPVWPMPNAGASLQALRDAGLVLGIVSNAQFFTPLLFPPLFGKSLKQFGFAPTLSYLSFAHGCAKPGTDLFELARLELDDAFSIPADQVLYVGNDMLNDVAASAAVGFRTALFAGDNRSLRRRTDDRRIAGVTPDLTLTDLSQLTDSLEILNSERSND